MTQTLSGPGRVRPPAFRPALYRSLQPLARVLSRSLWDIHVSGLEQVPGTGPLLLAGNHAGLLDGPLVCAFVPRPVRVLAKVELYHGFLGKALYAVGQIPVDRGKPDRAALRTSLRVLAAGGAVGVFPEGTRGAGGLEAAKHGVAYLALRSRAPVVPVACFGTAEAFPRGARRPTRGARVDVTFGAPFTVDVTGDPRVRRTVADAAEVIRIRLVEHLAQSRPR